MGSHNMRCAVRGCVSSVKTTGHLRFFSLPADPHRRRKWIALIGRQDILKKSTHHTSHRVCALHFHPLALKKTRMNRTVVPTLNLPGQNEQREEPTSSNQVEDITVYEDIPKKTFTVETQTDRLPVTIFREAQIQTDDIGLSPIALIKTEVEEITIDHDEEDSSDIDLDGMLEIELLTNALLSVEIPIDGDDVTSLQENHTISVLPIQLNTILNTENYVIKKEIR